MHTMTNEVPNPSEGSDTPHDKQQGQQEDVFPQKASVFPLYFANNSGGEVLAATATTAKNAQPAHFYCLEFCGHLRLRKPMQSSVKTNEHRTGMACTFTDAATTATATTTAATAASAEASASSIDGIPRSEERSENMLLANSTEGSAVDSTAEGTDRRSMQDVEFNKHRIKTKVNWTTELGTNLFLKFNPENPQQHIGATLIVGNKTLNGKTVKLEKPLALCRPVWSTVQTEPTTCDAEGTENIGSHTAVLKEGGLPSGLVIHGLVTEKIVFDERPVQSWIG
eukprot:Lankesteria_metandrocarpae@DN4402_c0_g1_i2.p1